MNEFEHDDSMHEPPMTDPVFGFDPVVEDAEEPSGLESMRNTARRRQRWLLGFVVAGGIGAVWTLKLIGGGLDEARGDTVVEQLIDHFISDGEQVEASTDQADDSSERTLLVLQESYQQQQVPVELLRCNPFLLGDRISDDRATSPEDTSDRRRQQRLDELETYVFDLPIDSTMTGARPMARIGGQLVQQGGTLEGAPADTVITLLAVERNMVTLEAHDPALDISGTWTRPVGR